MSLQWLLVSGVLYAEAGFMVILLLPFISPVRWQKILRLRLFANFLSYVGNYLNAVPLALVLLVADSLRDVWKYDAKLHSAHSNHHGASADMMHEFRAQRNFFISSTTLFLWFAIKRLITLILDSAQVMIENKQVKKQVESSVPAVLICDEANNDIHLENLKAKETEIRSLNDALKSAKADMETMKKQAESVSREYDNLLKEHAKLTTKLDDESGGESKKHN